MKLSWLDRGRQQLRKLIPDLSYKHLLLGSAVSLGLGVFLGFGIAMGMVKYQRQA